MAMASSRHGLPLVLSALLLAVLTLSAQADVKRYQFDIVMSNVSRLCHAKSMVTVNVGYPGPTIYAREGDRVVVRARHQPRGAHNVTIHCHGLKQRRNGWADGPANRGTLWWHAHIAWLRATVHGAVVVLPERGVPYPFPKPDAEAEIILGEWWHADVEAIEKQGRMPGMAPNTSDAHTINGKPGPLFPCSEKHTYALQVQWGKTYLLRVVNAAVNDELFFSIAGHTMTVVEIDATYTKPLAASTIQLSPGQTTNVLVRADQKPGRYFMAAKPFNHVPVPADDKTRPPPSSSTPASRPPSSPPRAVDRHLLYTIGLNIDPCRARSCLNGSRLAASLNNITFVMPAVALLQASSPPTSPTARPPARFNYTGVPLTTGLATSLGTRLSKVAYNLLSVESHPFHLHGYNFFVVGRGLGNFDPAKDPAKYNLVDPPERNTVGVPAGGWTAIRFRADNPGVWFLHCHLEGLKIAFLVEDGNGPDESVLPPPKDLPEC
ncbi:hypothetical protein SORBI_3003G231400 [Sorghum bicolor]|uniref:laccase n=1 Tax=Sorghum bicolor TaxID=4558 RepID=C5XEH6_SORBI|nr:hypothetical protein SORBI_3003G231400 [Sorghum bicolor]